MSRIKKIKKTILLNTKKTAVPKRYIKKVTLEDVVHLYKPEELNALVEISMESEKIQKNMIKKDPRLFEEVLETSCWELQAKI